jgi:hypothetical protein
VRRLFTWALVSLGIAALARRLRTRAATGSSGPIVDATPADDPADELRRKLAESRAEEEPVEPPVSAPETVEDRRAEVHDSGRATIDAMRESEDA